MKIARKILLVLLCLIMVAGLFSATAYAEETDEIMIIRNSDGSWYAEKNGTIIQNGWVHTSGTSTDSEGKPISWDVWYYAKNGLLISGWQQFDGVLYYFDGSGNPPRMATREWSINGKWYSFNKTTGALSTNGWVFQPLDDGNGGNWFYANEDGSLRSGWQQIDGKWYFFNTEDYTDENGNVWPQPPFMWCVDGGVRDLKASNSYEEELNETFWFFNPDGSLLEGEPGWHSVVNRSGRGPASWWFYVNADGSCRRGWIQDGGKWYYCNLVMFADGTFEIDGEDYTFDANGAWVEDGGSSSASGWAQEGGSWYYYENGSKVTGWQTIDGVWYYFDASGAMAEDAIVDGYYVDATGAMVSNSWIQKGGAWYYFGGDGAMLTGWQTIDGVWYYFYADGTMAANTTIDGYTIDGSGAWVA